MKIPPKATARPFKFSLSHPTTSTDDTKNRFRNRINQIRNEIERTEREYQLFQKQAQDSVIEASTNEETKQAILRPLLERFGLILIDVHKNKDQTTTRAKIGKKAKPDATDTTQINLF